MTRRWITSLQKLIAKGITNKDVLMVKLAEMQKVDGVWRLEKITKYPAHLEILVHKVRWYIYDTSADTLIIDTNLNDTDLGNTGETTGANRMFIITGCQFMQPLRVSFPKYQLLDKLDRVIAKCDTQRELQIIKNTLYAISPTEFKREPLCITKNADEKVK